jgi:hypothetical protein
LSPTLAHPAAAKEISTAAKNLRIPDSVAWDAFLHCINSELQLADAVSLRMFDCADTTASSDPDIAR